MKFVCERLGQFFLSWGFDKVSRLFEWKILTFLWEIEFLEFSMKFHNFHEIFQYSSHMSVCTWVCAWMMFKKCLWCVAGELSQQKHIETPCWFRYICYFYIRHLSSLLFTFCYFPIERWLFRCMYVRTRVRVCVCAINNRLMSLLFCLFIFLSFM